MKKLNLTHIHQSKCTIYNTK